MSCGSQGICNGGTQNKLNCNGRVSGIVLKGPISFNCSFIFSRERRDVTTSSDRNAGFRGSTRYFGVGVRLACYSCSLFLFLLFLCVLFSTLFAVFTKTRFRVFLGRFPRMFSVIRSHRFKCFNSEILANLWWYHHPFRTSWSSVIDENLVNRYFRFVVRAYTTRIRRVTRCVCVRYQVICILFGALLSHDSRFPVRVYDAI